MLLDVVFIFVGLALLLWGGDRFVTSAAALARNLGVSALLIGLTIVALGTSAPEIFVSIIASLRGNTGIAVGNALGSNITNIGLVIGITALVKPIRIQSQILLREFPILFFVMLLTAILFCDGDLNRFDGIALLIALVVFVGIIIRIGLKQHNHDPIEDEYAAEIPKDMSTRRAVAWILIGITLLPLGSNLLVIGASGIARSFGLSDLVIGLTIVAIGTSLPELVASLFGVLKGEDDIALGNVIGSNVFNLLAVLGIPGVIAPTSFGFVIMQRDFSFMLLLTVLLYWLARPRNQQPGIIGRGGGAMLLFFYVMYFCVLALSINLLQN